MSITVSVLFDNFKSSREWNKLSHNSQLLYQQMMKKAETDYFLITNRDTQITEEYVDKLYEKLKKNKSLAHANMFMKVMRRIWSVGKRKKWVKNNPFREMGLEAAPARTIRWTSEQVHKLIDTARTLGHYEVVVVASLCYGLGQRPGDITNLTRASFNSDFTEVKFTQQKTKKFMHLPVPEISRKYAKAWFSNPAHVFAPQRQFNTVYRFVLKEAGLPANLQIRDLRRTAILEIMESDGTDAEGQAISGHTDRQQLNTYSPSTLKMAINAQNKRFNGRV